MPSVGGPTVMDSVFGDRDPADDSNGEAGRSLIEARLRCSSPLVSLLHPGMVAPRENRSGAARGGLGMLPRGGRALCCAPGVRGGMVGAGCL